MDYRREIDGLRAIAVLPVILFHAGFAVFRGGFVGVDVFFVISGYLITGILMSDLREGSFSLVRFYERRARRILPALFFVMACCIPAAWIWMLPSQFEGFTKSLLLVSLFASNFLFGGQDGYFEPAAETQPLLHTWSLAVEEQYYIVFPVLLWLLWRYRRNSVVWIIALLAIASLITAEAGWRINPKANFFFTPARVWELLAGALCAFAPRFRPSLTSQGLSLVGLGMIAASILLFTAELPFPSLYTAIPVGGTVLIILFAVRGTLAARLLSLAPLAGIGLISYSAYLWHQPLFAFARLASVDPPGDAMLLALAAASLLLAYFSWRFVEQPFRRPWPKGFATRPFIFTTSLAGIAAFIAAGLTLDNRTYFERDLTEAGKRYYAYLDYHLSADYARQYRAPDCFYGSAQNSFSYFNQDRCLKRSDTRPNYIILGDSHAAHLWRAVDETFPEVNVMQASASGCLPLLPYQGRKRCTDLVRFIAEDYVTRNQVDGIILSARWNEESASRLPATVARLLQHVPHVIVLGPNIQLPNDLPIILGASNGEHLEEVAAHTRALLRSREFQVTDQMVEALKGSGAVFVPLIPHVCSAEACTLLADNGEPLIFDSAHFTLAGALSTVGRMRQSRALNLLNRP